MIPGSPPGLGTFSKKALSQIHDTSLVNIWVRVRSSETKNSETTFFSPRRPQNQDFRKSFARFGDGVRSGDPKIAKLVFSANLGRQALMGDPKIAKACVQKPFARFPKMFAILGDGVRSGEPKVAKPKLAKIVRYSW